MENTVIFQTFEWNSPSDGTFYDNLAAKAQELKELAVAAVWLPPAMKGVSPFDVGYTAYDIWDLGEFEQHGERRTKYGTVWQLRACIEALHEAGIQVFADLVYNHKGGADYTERCEAVPVNPDNRLEEVGKPREIEAWTGFNFPGRQGQYSDFVWNFNHFTGVDFDQLTGESGIFRILGENKTWAPDTDKEHGNFDYLMNADINHSHPEVREELIRNALWLIEEFGYDGFRLDAIKHISAEFIKELQARVRERYPETQFIGEYWQGSEAPLSAYLKFTDYNLRLFDVPLHFNLQAAASDPDYDYAKLFAGTLLQDSPLNSITFVDNHDSQPGQSLESWVAEEFRELANALILLKRDAYPCIFAGDFYGLEGSEYGGLGERLRLLLELRRDYAYGEEEVFLAEAGAYGIIRHGDEEHPGKLIFAFSRNGERELEVMLGEEYAGRTFLDRSNQEAEVEYRVDDDGVLRCQLEADQTVYLVTV
ncbi:MAG: alpha-amylase [Eubacteriales bacterium]|nr:alpha-amylase [Eubacteriales bacterium]